MANLTVKSVLAAAISVASFAFANAQCTVKASNDTIVCVYKPTVQLNATANNAIGYFWAPKQGLNDSTIANPVAKPTATTSYIITAVVPDNTELVVNGDFSSGNTGFSSSYSYRSNPSPGGSGNLQEGEYTVKTDPTTTHQCFANCKDKTTGSGNMLIFNGSKTANVSVWSQTIAVTTNTDYAFSAWLQNVTCPPYGYNAELQFSINGNLIGNIFRSDSAICKWKQFYQVWNSGSSTSATISIVNQYTSADGNDFALDDISFKKFCRATDTVTITINPPQSAITKTACAGDSVLIGGKYRKTSGTYYDTLGTLKGCDSLVTTNLQVGNISSTNNKTICTGDSILLQKKYRKTTGTYYDTLIAAKGCDSVVTTQLTVASNFTTTTDTTICGGDSILVNGKYRKNTGTYTDTLSASGNCKTVATTNITTISKTQKVIDALLCGVDSFYFKNKYFKTSGTYYDTVYKKHCPDTVKQLNLTAKAIDSSVFQFKLCPGDSIFWLTGFIKRDTAIYDTIKSPPNCDSLVITRVRVVNNPPHLTDTTYYCDDKIATLDAGNFVNYLWSDGSTGRYLNTTTDGNYWVEITDSNHCKFRDTGLVLERCDPRIFIPSSFSPNHDGKNDYFSIYTYNIIEFRFFIFDRWGEIIFETSDPHFIWLGKYKGEALITGIYHWVASYAGVNRNGKIIRKSDHGMITIIE